MGTISVTLPSDGETMDAADVNNPINTIVTLVNGNIDSDNVSAGGLTPANLVSGTGTSWAWQSWTPTWTNLTVGNGTVTAKYIQIGKTIHFRIGFVLGSTSAIAGAVAFTLPVTAISYPGTATLQVLGVGRLLDSGTASYEGRVSWASTTTAQIVVYLASGTYLASASISPTAPFTWTTSDEFYFQGVYEAA